MPRYRAFSSHLRARFGVRVQRVVLRGGFTCPNRDGTKGYGGCVYCSAASMTAPHVGAGDVALQLEEGIRRMARRYGARAFLAYFNDFSATYAPAGRLRALYDAALSHPSVVGLALGTRPDCLPEPVAELLADYARRTYLWVELGLQSASDEVLQLVNRGHSVRDFVEAVERLSNSGVAVCAHVIDGLCGQGLDDFLETARLLARLPVVGVKLHNLHVLRGSRLVRRFREGLVSVPGRDEYVEAVVRFLEHLPPSVVVHRLVADAPDRFLVAPDWMRDKTQVLRAISERLEAEDTWQGKALGAPREALCRDPALDEVFPSRKQVDTSVDNGDGSLDSDS